MTMLPPIMTGMISRPMRKALVRTAALYSRRATTSSLCTEGISPGEDRGGRRGRQHAVLVRLSDANEDVVQRWPRQLEVTHPALHHDAGQDLLRVGSLVQPQLLITAE